MFAPDITSYFMLPLLSTVTSQFMTLFEALRQSLLKSRILTATGVVNITLKPSSGIAI
jgi:hypothetical protein